MGTLANISGEEAAKAFARAGWQRLGQKGSHLVMIRPGSLQPLDPQHKELPVGTLRALIRTAGLSVDEFLKLV